MEQITGAEAFICVRVRGCVCTCVCVCVYVRACVNVYGGQIAQVLDLLWNNYKIIYFHNRITYISSPGRPSQSSNFNLVRRFRNERAKIINNWKKKNRKKNWMLFFKNESYLMDYTNNTEWEEQLIPHCLLFHPLPESCGATQTRIAHRLATFSYKFYHYDFSTDITKNT